MRIFREFDSDGDGFISPDELKTLLARYGYEASDEELKVNLKIFKSIFLFKNTQNLHKFVGKTHIKKLLNKTNY